MRNRQINQALRRAVQAETPDVLNQVLSADLQKEISTMEYQKKPLTYPRTHPPPPHTPKKKEEKKRKKKAK